MITNVVSLELIASYDLMLYVPGIVSFGIDQNVSHLNSFVVLHDSSCILSPSIFDISICMDVLLLYIMSQIRIGVFLCTIYPKFQRINLIYFIFFYHYSSFFYFPKQAALEWGEIS